MNVIFEKNGVVREVKKGYSWTTFFFAGWAQLIFRREWILGLALIIFNIPFAYIPGIIWGFFANKYTARNLAENGWNVQDKELAHVKSAMSTWGIH